MLLFKVTVAKITSGLTSIGLLLGHYVSEGVLRGKEQDAADLWRTYNDLKVTLTSRNLVCKKRTETAYILFYERQVRGHSEVNVVRSPGHFLNTELKNPSYLC